jgi:hypothetical protein
LCAVDAFNVLDQNESRGAVLAKPVIGGVASVARAKLFVASSRFAFSIAARLMKRVCTTRGRVYVTRRNDVVAQN